MSPHLLSAVARGAGSSLLRLQADDRLVALVRDRHDPAFSALVDRYGGELQRYAARLVGEDRAEDVVQQALINAHGALMGSDGDIQLRPWLYRIVHNAALNVLRASRPQAELDERLAAAGPGVAQDAETRERLREALAAIARLPGPQRDALTLQALEGRSHDEIAAALSVSPGAARQHLHRARGAVRAAVSAVTPYGLMIRFALADDGPATGALVSTAGAGASAGIAATVAKVGVGVLTAGAIATGTAGHVPFAAHHHAPARAAERRPAPAAQAAAAPAAPVAAPAQRGSAAHAGVERVYSTERPSPRRGPSPSSGESDGAAGSDDHGDGQSTQGSSGGSDYTAGRSSSGGGERTGSSSGPGSGDSSHSGSDGAAPAIEPATPQPLATSTSGEAVVASTDDSGHGGSGRSGDG